MRHLLRRHSPALICSIADQAIVSIATFLVGLLAARSLTPATYGSLALYVSTNLMVAGLQNALVLSPMRVFGVDALRAGRSSYFRTQLHIQFCLSIAIALVTVAVSRLFSVGLHNTVAFCVYCTFFQMQEFYRCVLQTRRRNYHLLAYDAIGQSARLALVAYSLHAGYSAIWQQLVALSIGHTITAWLASSVTKKSDSNSPSLSVALQQNARFGRWILLDGLSYITSTQAYLYFTAAWLGVEATAGLNAMQSLVNALNVVLVGTTAYLMPRARAQLIERGVRAWKLTLYRVGIALTIATTLLAILVASNATTIVATVYSPYFLAYTALVPCLAASYVLQAANTILNCAFQTANAPHVGFAAKAFAAIVAIAASYPLLATYGTVGAAIGLLLTQIMSLVGYLTYIARHELSDQRIIARHATNTLDREPPSAQDDRRQ